MQTAINEWLFSADMEIIEMKINDKMFVVRKLMAIQKHTVSLQSES